MIKLILCIVFVGVSAFAKAQSPSPLLIKRVPLNADIFYGVDDFEQLYYSTNNVFYKRAFETSIPSQQFYDVQLGELTSVDLINPLKIVLFYKDTQTVVFLDNRLNESLRIDLSTLRPYRYFDHVGLAGERRLWLFNTDASRVEIYDYTTDRLIVSSPVVQSDVLSMMTDYNFCHLLLPQGIASYNNYGSQVHYLPLETTGLADYDFEELVVRQEKQWLTYVFKQDYSFEQKQSPWLWSDNDAPESFYLKNGKLYLYRRNQLIVLTD